MRDPVLDLLRAIRDGRPWRALADEVRAAGCWDLAKLEEAIRDGERLDALRETQAALRRGEVPECAARRFRQDASQN